MGEVTIHPLEKLRREKRLTQIEVGDAIFASATTIRHAENGKPIGRKFIDRLLTWADGRLKRDDFVERGGQNGKERKISKRKRPQNGAGAGKGKQRTQRGRGARVPARPAQSS